METLGERTLIRVDARAWERAICAPLATVMLADVEVLLRVDTGVKQMMGVLAHFDAWLQHAAHVSSHCGVRH